MVLLGPHGTELMARAMLYAALGRGIWIKNDNAIYTNVIMCEVPGEAEAGARVDPGGGIRT